MNKTLADFEPEWLKELRGQIKGQGSGFYRLQYAYRDMGKLIQLLDARTAASADYESILRAAFEEYQPTEEILEEYCEEGMSEPTGVIPVGEALMSFEDWIIRLKIKAKEISNARR